MRSLESKFLRSGASVFIASAIISKPVGTLK